MSAEILIQVEPGIKLEELLLRNYPRIQAKLPKDFELPKPETIDIFGQDSDRYYFVLDYGKAGALHMFHDKQRSWTDAGFLEVANICCLYDTNSKPLSGIKVFRPDVGGNVVTVTQNYEELLPFLLIPAFFRNLSYSATASSQYPVEKVNTVTSQVLGFLQDIATSSFYSLNDEKVDESKTVNTDFMNRVTAKVPFQHFKVLYKN